MALHIKMRDGEKMIVNGAVLVSRGGSHLVLENRASIMRGRDVMSPEEASTPARKLYFACMLAYIDAENVGQHRDLILALLSEVINTLDAAEAKAACVRFATLVAGMDFYQALATCRDLIRYEDEERFVAASEEADASSELLCERS
jgi:flagellar protein FlbT